MLYKTTLTDTVTALRSMENQHIKQHTNLITRRRRRLFTDIHIM